MRAASFARVPAPVFGGQAEMTPLLPQGCPVAADRVPAADEGEAPLPGTEQEEGARG